MACLIKVPDGDAKGVVSFTTPERDHLIRAFPDIAAAVQRLKSRYLIGLHHNWHDAHFRHDPLFDFNLAGEDDLVAADSKWFPLVPMDACNFSPPVFAPGGERFWDVLFVARGVKFKGIPEFFRAIRTLYDGGSLLRVLVLCPIPPSGPGTEDGLRALHASLFNAEERRHFTFLTMEWDYPFPLDIPTLAHFYRSSRVFVHSARDERRCRVAAYAWASAMPVVGMACIGSILPAALRVAPYFFECASYEDFPRAICAALSAAAAKSDFGPVRRQMATNEAALMMENSLAELARMRGEKLSSIPMNPAGFDLRLGRHHGLATGPNRIEQDIGAFMKVLSELPDKDLWDLAQNTNPEIAIATSFPAVPRSVSEPEHSGISRRLVRRLVRVFS